MVVEPFLKIGFPIKNESYKLIVNYGAEQMVPKITLTTSLNSSIFWTIKSECKRKEVIKFAIFASGMAFKIFI